MTFRPDWPAATTYAKGDFIQFFVESPDGFTRYNASWILTGDNPDDVLPMNSRMWTPFLVVPRARFQGEWQARHDYYEAMDLVTLKGRLYVCGAPDGDPQCSGTPLSSIGWVQLANRSTLLSGAKNPDQRDGTPGTYWINTVTRMLIGPKTAAGWPDTGGTSLAGTVKGKKGPAGIGGVKGPTGGQGQAGLTGPAGKAGPAGVAGQQGTAGPKGEKGDTSAGLEVVDKTGKAIGVLSGTQLIITTPDGPVALSDITPNDYGGSQPLLYESLNCRGTAYWESTALWPVARIMDPYGNSTGPDGRALFSGDLTYAKGPLQEHLFRSALDGGRCNIYAGEGMTLTAGEAATMAVSWKTPIRVGN